MNIFTALLISVGLNIAMFIPALLWRTDKLTDISYALTFILISLLGFTASVVNVSTALLLAMIWLWALRLGSYLLLRIFKMGKDDRFDKIRNHKIKFGGFWLLQGLTVWVLMLPSLLFFSHPPQTLGWLSWVGIIIWAVGFLIETVADWQKYQFRTAASPKGFIDFGLWRYSRHPNYFGEILVWLGIYLYTLHALSMGDSLIGLLSPLFIAFMLIFVSGIPPLEKSADARFKDNLEYRKYKQETNRLIPWFK
jgi:steroid 5-alpha reductase family enzyme